jgi:uncharacterized protein GlcG (DUF336 family)
MQQSFIETVPQLTLEAARSVSRAVFEEAEQQGCAVVVAVLDAGGQILLVERGMGAPTSSIEIAKRKAECAASFGAATDLFAAACKTMPAIAALPHMLPFEGGVPVIVDGRIAGAIGVSGASREQDLACVQAGLAAIQA